LCLKSITKQIHARQRDVNSYKKSRIGGSLILKGGEWTPHDLRRTDATMMGNLGVRPDVIGKCLDHVEQNRLMRIYQRQKLEAEQRAAWKLLGERLELTIKAASNSSTETNDRKMTAPELLAA
jgi:integrase